MASTLSKSLALEKLAKGKGKAAEETEKGIPLAPSKKDLKPWYVASRSRLGSDDADEATGDAEGDEESEKARIRRCAFFKVILTQSLDIWLYQIKRTLPQIVLRPSNVHQSRTGLEISFSTLININFKAILTTLT